MLSPTLELTFRKTIFKFLVIFSNPKVHHCRGGFYSIPSTGVDWNSKFWKLTLPAIGHTLYCVESFEQNRGLFPLTSFYSLKALLKSMVPFILWEYCMYHTSPKIVLDTCNISFYFPSQILHNLNILLWLVFYFYFSK